MNEDQGIALLTHNVGGRGNVSWKLGSAVAYEYQICLPSPPQRPSLVRTSSKGTKSFKL